MPNPQPTRQRVFTAATPKVADSLFYELKEKSRIVIPETGTLHPDTVTSPNFAFCHYETVDEQGDWLRLWYIAPRADQDDYNWEFTSADIGGTRFNAVARTYVTPRSLINTNAADYAGFDPDVPAMGAAMPNVPKDRFTGSYVLAERKEVRSGDPKIDSLFVIDQHVYVKRVSIAEGQFDEVCRRNLTTTQTLYYSGETIPGTGKTIDELTADGDNTYWGLQADGLLREWKQLSATWFAVTEREVVAGTFVGGVVEISSFSGNIGYSWPAVLDNIELMDWRRRDGQTEIHPKVTYDPEGYSGPCACTTTRTWSKTAFVIPKVDQMLPTGIYYSSPFYNLNVPECLHGAITVQCDIGNTDPTYTQNVGSARTFEATNYVVWPSTITAYDNQEEFRGGFLRTVRVVSKPS